MHNFTYHLSKRFKSDLKYIRYLKAGIRSDHHFPSLNYSARRLTDSSNHFLFGYLGSNYNLIKESLGVSNCLYVFDNPAIRLKNFPVVRVHSKSLAYAKIDQSYNFYFNFKYNTALHFLQQIATRQCSASETKLSNTLLLYDKSYPFNSLISQYNKKLCDDYDAEISSLQSAKSLTTFLSRKPIYVSSVNSRGTPTFSKSSISVLPGTPSYVASFQSTAIINYLFNDSVECIMAPCNPWYIENYKEQRSSPRFLSELANRFATTHFFFEELLLFVDL